MVIRLLILLLSGTALSAFDQKDLDKMILEAPSREEVVLPDGIYTDAQLVIKTSGTSSRPFVVRAKTPGKAIFSGKSCGLIEGDHVEVFGLLFQNAGIPERARHLFWVKGSFCRVSECGFVDCNESFGPEKKDAKWICLNGVSNRFDRNMTSGKKTVNAVLQIEVEESRPNGHIVEGNFFGPRPPLGQNGGETIRIGYSHQAYFTSGAVIARNYFEGCNGDVEVVSVKSTSNFILQNTFRNCAGTLTLRHGNGSHVEGNLFLGERNKSSGGIRIIGAGHKVSSNVCYQTGARAGASIAVTSAQVDFKPSGYWTVENVEIEGNLLFDNDADGIALSAMHGRGQGAEIQNVSPKNLRIRNNQIRLKSGFSAFTGPVGKDVVFKSNQFQGGEPGVFPGESSEVSEKLLQGFLNQALTRADAGPAWSK